MHGASDGSTFSITNNGYMTLEAWEGIKRNMAKGIIKLPIIWDSPYNWWVLNFFNGLVPHTSSLKSINTYKKYKVLMLKEEGNTSHVCQIYDQDYANQDKYRFRYDTYVLRLWIPETRGTLNYWCLVNVGLQAVRILPRKSWVYSFNRINLYPKHRVSFSQWWNCIKSFLQGWYYFKQDTTLTISD